MTSQGIFSCFFRGTGASLTVQEIINKDMEEIKIGQTLAAGSVVAVAAAASSVGLLPHSILHSIVTGVKAGTVLVVTKTVLSRLMPGHKKGVDNPAERKLCEEFFKLPVFFHHVIAPCIKGIPWRIIYSVADSAVSAFNMPATLATTLATVATSIAHGACQSNGTFAGGVVEGLLSQFMLFPAYYAGGLPGVLIAEAVKGVLVMGSEKWRYVSSHLDELQKEQH